jgi:hypothetical protein
VLCFMALIVGLYFNWCEVEPMVFQVGFITVSMASLATNGLMNLTLLFMRFIISALRWENSFVIIKSRMEVIPTTKELADVFMASYELVNAKAGSIRIRMTSKRNDMIRSEDKGRDKKGATSTETNRSGT